MDQPSLTNLLVLGSCNAILFLSQQQSQVNNKIKPHMFHGSWLILVWLMAWTGWDVRHIYRIVVRRERVCVCVCLATVITIIKGSSLFGP